MVDNKISTSQVQHIANLANLKLSQEEVEKYQKQLSNILAYVDKLQEVNTDGVEETSQVTGLTNVFNKDGEVQKQTFSQEEALKNSKHQNGKYFQVPVVISKK
jgi:aspartyl-tRNA(Asn)/glutamyl-tRNA(Gln) amidotransferase subunit C